MRKIEAIVRPFVIDRVRERLGELDCGGMTVTSVRGVGRQLGRTEVYRGAEYRIDFLPKLKLEVAVPEDRVEKVVTAIEEVCRTGKIGDGRSSSRPSPTSSASAPANAAKPR